MARDVPVSVSMPRPGPGPHQREIADLTVALSAVFGQMGPRINLNLPDDGTDPAVRLTAGQTTPALITADQDDYDPGDTLLLRLSTDASRNVTGLAAGFNGELRLVVNVGSNDLVLQNQNAGSAAANRIITGTGADLTLGADGAALLLYDGTTARWRVVA